MALARFRSLCRADTEAGHKSRIIMHGTNHYLQTTQSTGIICGAARYFWLIMRRCMLPNGKFRPRARETTRMTNVHSSTSGFLWPLRTNGRRREGVTRISRTLFINLSEATLHFSSYPLQRNRPYVKITRKKKKKKRGGAATVPLAALRTAGVNAHGGDSVCPGGRAGSSDTL